MAFQPFEHWVNADLKAEVPVVQLRNGFFTQDNLGALLGVKVFDNGQEHALTGSVLYYAKLADGTTLESDSVQPDGNTASVVLPSEAYAAVGPISVAVANRDGAKQKVLAIFTGYVYETKTDAEVAPGQTVADLAQLQAQYQAMLTATANAVTATTNAEKVNIAQSKTGHVITVTTTDRNGTDTAKTIVEPTVALRSENGEISLEVTDSNGTSSTSFPDPSEEVKKKVNRSSVTATRTISGTGSVTMEDALDEPAKIELKLNPKQDLHGYDKPWVGGAGKNIASPVTDSNGWSINVGGSFSVNGDILTVEITAGVSSGVYAKSGSTLRNILASLSGQYTWSIDVKSSASISAAIGVQSIAMRNNVNVGTSWTRISGTGTFNATSVTFVIYNNGGTAATIEARNLQIEAGSTATDYEPYSNICPITGYDSVEVVSTGKNLLNPYGLKTVTTGNGQRIGQEFDTPGTYTLKNNVLYSGSTAFYVTIRTGASYTAGEQILISSQTVAHTFTISDGQTLIVHGGSNIEENTVRNYILSSLIQLELGSTATSYEPFGQSLSLNLVSATGSTVYGGTLTLNEDGSGTVVITNATDVWDGTEAIIKGSNLNNYYITIDNGSIAGRTTAGWMTKSQLDDINLMCNLAEVNDDNTHDSYIHASAYCGSAIVLQPRIFLPDCSTVAEAKTWLAEQNTSGHPLTWSYKLKEPAVYALSASQLSTLLGTTNVITDTDEPLTVTYRTDKYLTTATIDDFFVFMVDGTNTTELFKKWWDMTENSGTRYERLERWFKILAKAWKDKLYILECPSAENQSTSTITYRGDLQRKTPAGEWTDEDPMTWYIRVNGLNQADGTLDVLAIEGLDDDFDITGELAPVQTVSMALWVNIHQDTNQWIYNGQYTVNGTGSDNGVRTYVYFSTSPTKENSNFPYVAPATFLKPLPGDVMPNGKHRSLTWHSTFPGGLTSDGKLTSGRGLQPYIYQSASSGLTAARKWSEDEALWNDCDSLWLLLQWQLRHGDLENSGIMEVCQAFNFQWMCAEATTDQNYVLLPASAYTIFQNIDRNAIKYICLSVGEMGTNTNKDRGQSYMYNILDRGQVRSVAMSGGYCKVTFFTTATFSTTTTTCVSTMPWYSGATEAITGKGDCAPTTSPLLGYTPIRVTGVEIMSGAYDVGIEPLYYATYDSSTATTTYTVNECRTASKLATSVTSDYINTGLGNTTPWATGWQYVKSFNFDLSKSALFPKAVGGSATTYYKSAFNVTASSGARVPTRFGSLPLGAPAGLACCGGNLAPGAVRWFLRPRLSGSGANRGE